MAGEGNDHSDVIEAYGLTKAYGEHRVLHGLDLRVAPGTIHALLGPNGAGKTTAVRILATLTAPDAGHARVAGHDIRTARRAVRRAISLTGQFAAVDETQTGEENLRMTARLAGRSRRDARHVAAELLERFDLAAHGRALVRTYSGGMRRRLDLAAGLVGTPSVLFLDEPTTGLDPRSRQQLWGTVEELAAEGATVLLTTQYLEEADRLAHRIALLHGGRIAAEGTAAELKSRVARHRVDVTAADSAAYLRLVPRVDRCAARQTQPSRRSQDTPRSPGTLTFSLPTDGTARAVRALLDELDPTGRDIARFALHAATLDDVFLALTEDPTEDPGAPAPSPLPGRRSARA